MIKKANRKAKKVFSTLKNLLNIAAEMWVSQSMVQFLQYTTFDG